MKLDALGGEYRDLQTGGRPGLRAMVPYTEENCETDWLELYPLADVTYFFGNSPEVTMKHYHKTRDEIFEKVAGSKTSAFVPKTDVAGSG